ncbi:MAG: hypothetical protein E7242_00930 [Lachnospiraceae bacterium]|nr:hypothetical protein [Lachnospiraceae bacterium]
MEENIRELFEEVRRIHQTNQKCDIRALDDAARKDFLKTHERLLSIKEIDQTIEEVRAEMRINNE